MSRWIVILAAMFVGASSAVARPVSFLGGYSLMSENRFDQNELMVGYTFLPRLAVGAHYALFRYSGVEENHAAALLHARVLRLNTDFWQANLYASAGPEVQFLPSSPGVGRVAAALEADAETRVFYASVRAEGWGYFGPDTRHYFRGRVGFAPYLSEVNGLHAWLIAQAEYNTWRTSWEGTPLLRLSYQNLFFESGMSLTGKVQLSFSVEL
jgi:hypothetical protein